MHGRPERKKMEDRISQLYGDLEILTDLAQRMLDQITEAQYTLQDLTQKK
jgi:hypothetical protein